MDVLLNGHSALDSDNFIPAMENISQVDSFLEGYGLDTTNPVIKAELFGNFQEALQFIKRYFLKEGSEDGVDLKIPASAYMVTDINSLFLIATDNKKYSSYEMCWAEIILKVMHTILHVDKDLRSNYFAEIQTQIFDSFYKHIFRDENNNLFLGERGSCQISLVDFETKAKKTRDSVIIKLLHKPDNVAEELFDRVGVRFITHNKYDAMRVTKYLVDNNIVVPHNIKPSRSMNTLLDLEKFKSIVKKATRKSMREEWSEDFYLEEVKKEIQKITASDALSRNMHTKKSYTSIQFTSRRLITYRNPFVRSFGSLREDAKELAENNELARKVLSLDISQIARDIRFFYPCEVQILDTDAHRNNTEGDASHEQYKKNQKNAALQRLFWKLIKEND